MKANLLIGRIKFITAFFILVIIGERKPWAADALADKGMKNVAAQVGTAILKLGKEDINSAFKPIELSWELKNALDSSRIVSSLTQAAKAADTIECVGFNAISTQVFSLIYVLCEANGPWAVKVDLYTYKDALYVNGFELTHQWARMEQMITVVEKLPTPLKISR